MRERVNRRTLNETRRKLSEADIIIKNNSRATVVLSSARNGGNTYILEQYETEDVTFDDLQSIVKKHKKLFEDFTVMIEDVYCPIDESLTVEDVEDVLGLSRIKKGLSDTPDEIMFDDMLLDYSVEDFEEELKSFNIKLAERLTERAIYLYNNEEFSNSFKIKMLEEKIKSNNLFEDIENLRQINRGK